MAERTREAGASRVVCLREWLKSIHERMELEDKPWPEDLPWSPRPTTRSS